MTSAIFFDLLVDRFPWVWMKESPQIIFGALELLGLVFLVKMIAQRRRNRHLVVRVPEHTDNQSNAFALLAEYSPQNAQGCSSYGTGNATSISPHAP